MSGWYDRIQNAQVGGGGGAKFLPGNYILLVEDVKEHKGPSGVFFIVETKVLQSDNPQLPVGVAASQVIKLDGQFPETALGDVKAFAAAVLGMDPKDAARVNAEITPQVIAGILHRPVPVRGHIVGANVWMKNPTARSRPGTQPFAKINWLQRLGQDGRPERTELPALVDPPPQGQGGYGQPPQGQYGAPGGYGQPPAGQYGAPPQGQGYGQPPPQGGGYTPPGGPANPGPMSYGQPPTQGGPPPGGWGAQAPGIAPPAQGQPGGWAPPAWGQAAPPAQGQPPAGQYGAPPAQGGYQAPGGAPAGQYGAPPAGAPPAVPGWGAPQNQPPAGQFPPAGWTAHPQAPGHFYRGNDVLSESQLRAAMAAGRA